MKRSMLLFKCIFRMEQEMKLQENKKILTVARLLRILVSQRIFLLYITSCNLIQLQILRQKNHCRKYLSHCSHIWIGFVISAANPFVLISLVHPLHFMESLNTLQIVWWFLGRHWFPSLLQTQIGISLQMFVVPIVVSRWTLKLNVWQRRCFEVS